MRKSLILIPTVMMAIGVTGVRFAHANTATPPAHVQLAPSTAPAPSTAADADNVDVQSGDQSGVDAPEAAGAPESSAPEASAPDTDTIQSSDQTGPDTGGADTGTAASGK